MAEGDAVAAFLGTGTVNRQPASGVEEQISSIVKDAATDSINMFDGTTAHKILDTTTLTSVTDPASTSATRRNAYNMALMITNSVFLRKLGTTDELYVGGVQTNV